MNSGPTTISHNTSPRGFGGGLISVAGASLDVYASQELNSAPSRTESADVAVRTVRNVATAAVRAEARRDVFAD